MHTARLPGQTRVRGVTARPVRAKFGLMPRTTALPAVLRRPRLACGAALAAVALGVQAAPVDLDSALAAPDPYELAARWTVASLSSAGVGAPLSALQPLAAPGAPAAPDRASLPAALRHTGLPLASGDAKAPDPAAYALMGLALLVAGLLVQRLRRRHDAHATRARPTRM